MIDKDTQAPYRYIAHVLQVIWDHKRIPLVYYKVYSPL